MGFFSKFFGGSSGDVASEPGHDIAELARRLKSTPEALRGIPIAYREIHIPKRDGTTRTLHAPAESLKLLQRQLLHRLFGHLAAHPAAMGFEKGQSIATNAAAHVGATVLLKMDLRDFFTQTTAKRLRAYFIAIGWNGEVADLLVKLTTHNKGLPQGAPTSPRLCNLVNYLLDARLFAMGLKLGAKYTRYADDITFSFSEDSRQKIADAIVWTKQTVGDCGYTLHQKKKLQIRRRHDCMLVTGIVVNTTLNLPRETRRLLRAVEHHLKTGKPATLTSAQLRGWHALQSMITAKRPS